MKLLQPDGTVEELTMADYLFGVVAAEMPAAFEEEALKAQACAARTYTVVRQASANAAHPQADVYRQRLLSGLCGAADGGDPMGDQCRDLLRQDQPGGGGH